MRSECMYNVQMVHYYRIREIGVLLNFSECGPKCVPKCKNRFIDLLKGLACTFL